MDDAKARELLEKRIHEAEKRVRELAKEINEAVMRGDLDCPLAQLVK